MITDAKAGDWDDATKWVGGSVPLVTDDVTTSYDTTITSGLGVTPKLCKTLVQNGGLSCPGGGSFVQVTNNYTLNGVLSTLVRSGGTVEIAATAYLVATAAITPILDGTGTAYVRDGVTTALGATVGTNGNDFAAINLYAAAFVADLCASKSYLFGTARIVNSTAHNTNYVMYAGSIISGGTNLDEVWSMEAGSLISGGTFNGGCDNGDITNVFNGTISGGTLQNTRSGAYDFTINSSNPVFALTSSLDVQNGVTLTCHAITTPRGRGSVTTEGTGLIITTGLTLAKPWSLAANIRGPILVAAAAGGTNFDPAKP